MQMPSRARTWQHEVDIVGLRFRFKRDGRRALADMIAKRGSITGMRLIREPDNRADPNAIMVCLPQRILDGKQLGYLHKETAAVLAPALDSGRTVVLRATLESLYEDEEWNRGNMIVWFKDLPKPAAKRKVHT
jgi:hypothetical protein